MNFIQVQDTNNGATFIDLDKVEAVAVQVVRTPEKVQPGGFEITTMTQNPSRTIPASEETIVTLTLAGRDYTLRYADTSEAHELLNQKLKLSVPFEIFK